ncbi:AMP-binding protein, partial [Streptomyces sp. MBT57]|nr:AMP-binding protein [Streptomyces sp. MBT57]
MEPNSSPNRPAAAADASVRVPGAHTDTFTRDHLPPPQQWPELLLDDPAPRYPDRLNCGHELLDRTVEERGPDRPALRSGDGGVWSYGELRETVDRIAHVLTDDLAVVPGNRVLLRGPTTPWLAACWLAVMKAGAVAVTVLAQARTSELATICSIARVSHALCDARSAEDLVKADVEGLRTTLFGGDGPEDLTRLAAAHSGSGPYRAVDTAADEVALIAFTSGTTGRPKGCMHLHRDLLAIADTFSRQVLRPVPDDVFAGSPPLGFTFGLGGLLVFPLRAGASTLLLEQAGPNHLLPALARHRVSVLFTAPTAYRTMLGQLDGHDLSALRRCVSAGENLPAATWQAWFEATGLRIINGIGATELLHIFISAA